MQKYIEEVGMQTGRKGNNVWCLSLYVQNRKTHFIAHLSIDTVKPVNGWRKDPFTPQEENGTYTVWGVMTQEQVWQHYYRVFRISAVKSKPII